MDFGSLQTVTAWRLAKAGVACQGIVVHGPEGFRLVVIENQQIVEWTRFSSVFALREHLRAAVKKRQQAGWLVQSTAQMQRTRRAQRGRGLLRIAEQVEHPYP
jgi:hypothetical protein